MFFENRPRPWYLAMSVLFTVTGAVLIWLDPDVLVLFQTWLFTLIWAANVVGCLSFYALHRVHFRSHQDTPLSEEEPPL